ncbi:hypothetical protein ABPG72_004357 [Tetrahymena utriculariae]
MNGVQRRLNWGRINQPLIQLDTTTLGCAHKKCLSKQLSQNIFYRIAMLQFLQINLIKSRTQLIDYFLPLKINKQFIFKNSTDLYKKQKKKQIKQKQNKHQILKILQNNQQIKQNLHIKIDIS